MTKRILFSHCDLDGIGAGILFKKANGKDSEVHYCGYDTINERVQNRLIQLRKAGETSEIFITDISVNAEVAKALDEYPGTKILLDHHESAKWLAEKYPWASVDTKSCGTKLLFEHYTKDRENAQIQPYAGFVEHVNDYDLWIHAKPASKELNRLFFIVGIERFEKRMLAYPEIRFVKSERLLLDLEDETLRKYTKRVSRGMSKHEWNGDTSCGIAYAERFHSEVAHELMNQNGLDMIAIVDVNLHKVSLRSRKGVNVSKIAGVLGGGGHPNASGFAIDETFMTAPKLNDKLQSAYESIISAEMEQAMFIAEINENAFAGGVA